MIRFITTLSLLTLLLTGCASKAGTDWSDRRQSTPREELALEDIPLIPRTVFFDNPDRAAVRISPDGRWLSWLAPLDGVLNVHVAPVDDLDAAEPVTFDNDRGVRIYFWSYDADRIVFLQDEKGDENWRVYTVHVETKEKRDLTPLEGVRAEIQEVSPDFPDEVLIGLNDRDAQYHDIYRVNLATGERVLVQQNTEFAGFVTDDEYKVRFASKYNPDGTVSYLVPDGEGGWDPFLNIPEEDTLNTAIAGFTKDLKSVYMIDSRGRDTSALKVMELETGDSKLIAEDPRADLSGTMAHPTEKNIQAVAFNFDRERWTILDEAIRDDIEYLRELNRGEMNVISRTLADDKWVVAYLRDDGPVEYFLYDKGAKEGTFLFTNRTNLEGRPLARMEPVVIKSRDGLDLVSYLTLPLHAGLNENGRPTSPLPMVLDVHGGPWARDTWGYNPTHQWLANRGYAVLSVNFRGSTGFGKGFVNAGNKEWGAAMHDDLIDAVNWAVDEGIADRDKVAITGGSYGGYAALAGLTFTPDVFAAAVAVVGPSNLVTLLNSIPPYWAPALELFRTRVGDHTTEEGRAFLESRSPLTYVDRIERPLLIAQGANDPRVKQAESDQIVEAMKAKNIPVTYLLYPDEGHGFARPENRMSFYAVQEAFLGEQLGGRIEPIGNAFESSTITVPAGAGEVPGLEAAIN